MAGAWFRISWTPWASANLFTFSLGRLLGRQQMLIGQLERAREALAEQAVADERRRIARELHDLAGHTLAAMLLHITGARMCCDATWTRLSGPCSKQSDRRSSLDQIRATVSALRTSDAEPIRPWPSSDLVAMIEQYRQAGLRSMRGSPLRQRGWWGRPALRCTASLGSARQRRRHAPLNSVDLSLYVNDGQAHLLVADHGRPGARPDPDVGHFGLVGMRERARALAATSSAADTGRLARGRPPTSSTIRAQPRSERAT